VGATVAVGKQQVEVMAQGVAQQQNIAQDVKLAQLQQTDAGTGEGAGMGEAAEKYAVHELAGVVPGLSIADAVASLYDMSLTGKGMGAKPVQ
jgi:hypothetical protein